MRKKSELSNVINPKYNKLVADISMALNQGRMSTYNAINRELIKTYWEI